MNHYRTTLTLNVPARMEFVNITPEVEAALAESGVREGLCLVNAMHITASVFINDDEPGLHADYQKWLEQLAPFDPSPTRYQHNRTGEDNGDAHLKRTLMGHQVIVPITNGTLFTYAPPPALFRCPAQARRSCRPDRSDPSVRGLTGDAPACRRRPTIRRLRGELPRRDLARSGEAPPARPRLIAGTP